MRSFWLLGCLVLAWAEAQAQNAWPRGLYIEGGIHLGSNIRHTEKIQLPIQKLLASGGELALEYDPDGSRPWHHTANHARFGLMATWLWFGDARHLGHGTGLAPFVCWDWLRRPRWRLYGRLAMGLGWITKPYHPVSNPDNNFIGSHLNNCTALRLGASFLVHPHWELRPSLSFTHFSNGASQMPNLGINTWSGHLGLCYRPQPSRPHLRPVSEADTSQQHRAWGGALALGLGFRESSTVGGPKFPVSLVSAEVFWNFRRSQQWRWGLEWEWNGATHAFLAHQGLYAPKESFKQATRWAAYTGWDMRIHRVSFGAHLGFYLSDHLLQPWFMYTRVWVRYYWLPLQKYRLQPFVGLTLKAHQITAEYFALSLGMALHR